MRPLILAFLILLSAGLGFSKPKSSMPRDAATVRKEQAQVKQKMGQTKQQIEENKRKTRSKLNQINSLNAQISTTNENITSIQSTIADLAVREARLNDSIAAVEARIEKLRRDYTSLLRNARRRHKDLSELSLIFSAESFNSAMKRSSYIRQIGGSVDQKAKTLGDAQQVLDAKRQELTQLKQRQQALLDNLSDEKKKLNQQVNQNQTLVNQLQREASSLSQVLQQQQQEARSLDAELNRIIEEEMRRAEAERKAREAEERRLAEERRRQQEEKEKAQAQTGNKGSDAKGKKGKNADKGKNSSPKPNDKIANANTSTSKSKPAVLTGSFAANKGHLLFPVNGKYSIVGTFGVHKHKDLPYVQTDNSGIDIEAQPGATARAVYDGEVSSIFFHPAYQNIVMVRHGEYLTVYANISRLTVKKGDKVKAGQTLGHVYSDPHDSNRTVLHFEVRKEKQKLNPLDWISR